MSIDLKDPIGRFVYTERYAPEKRTALIDQLEEYPARVEKAVRGLTDVRLDQSYREGGWTIRQIVHHIADANMQFNARFRLALTNNGVTITPFDENAWAILPDALKAPLEPSLILLKGTHARWSLLLRAMTDAQFNNSFVHPRYGELTLDRALGMFTWHSYHHLAQIEEFRKLKGW